MSTDQFVKLATFQFTSEALIVKGKLESEGVEVFLRDNLTIDTDPMVSNAIGGVKLFVKQEDQTNAVEILESISKYSLDDNGSAIECPKCGSAKVDYFTTVRDIKSLFSFLFSLLLLLLPFYAKHKYKCETCNFEFDQS
ncbi:DUF2007 domain-containing protein [Flavobacterium sp. SM15]|uniref:DUF2007 domain-containing protein n=1 Tax=Flavobacterium sp. SM15 TaxID=2908005 RepID=UPI001EDC5B64|nr:DUF2007 domain-containing protein [Flavobacterium sp. SM15]MCG2612183.1 DUF2007 domain-containing protein [Flavobacterium sp. SM15]